MAQAKLKVQPTGRLVKVLLDLFSSGTRQFEPKLKAAPYGSI
jgi:hypothetical protein